MIMCPSLYFTLFFFIFLLTLKLLFQSTRLKKNLPPGPLHFPIIGNIYLLKQPLHRTLQNLSQKYGQIMSLRFGSQLVIVVSSPSIAQECFTKNDIVLANRPSLLLGKIIAYNNTVVSLSPYGDHWRNLRRIIQLEVLSSHRLNTCYEIRRDEIMRLVQNLANKVTSCKINNNNNNNGFVKVELKSMLSQMTFNTMTRMMSGKRYLGDDCDVSNYVEEARRFREIVKELLPLGGANNPGDFIPILRLFDFDGLEKKLKSLGKKIDVFLQGLIDEHRNSGQHSNTMIDHLLIQQQSQPEYYTDEIIKGLILVMLLAGTETSAATLEWTMSNLLDHPKIIEKAKSELYTHIGQDCLVDEHDMPNLPYLQNIVNETLRLHPAAPLLLPHFSSEDCTIGGYNVPRNTMVLVNAWAIHRDPNLWSEPTCFKPERFEKEGEASKLLSFGLGRRACPGANLAQRTVSLTLGLLIQCFEWKRISEESIDMSEARGLTVHKKIPLEAMCKLTLPSSRILSTF